jgi:lysozyme
LPCRPQFDRASGTAGLFFSLALLVALPIGARQLPLGPGLLGTSQQSLRPAQSQGSPFRITPERRALLNTIRYAEGTWIGGSQEGYRILFGGGRIDRLDRHPEVVMQLTYTSAAAGAYQFLPATWREASTKLGLNDFGPASQDQAALYLMHRRGALETFDRRGLNREVLHRLSQEWASLPATHGGSFYGQPVKDADELKEFYLADLQRQKRLTAEGSSAA